MHQPWREGGGIDGKEGGKEGGWKEGGEGRGWRERRGEREGKRGRKDDVIGGEPRLTSIHLASAISLGLTCMSVFSGLSRHTKYKSSIPHW